MALLRSIATVGGFTMGSRILGFARDILVAAALGAGPVADAFFVAFKFPNLFRRLFAEGAFNAAFIPLFAKRLETDGPDAAQRFAEQAFGVLGAVLLALVVAVELAMGWVMMAFAPGFVDEPGKFELTVLLARITFPYLLFISVVALLAGVLNSLGRFAAAAATPILLNVCLIGAVLVLTPVMPTAGHALAIGVAVAGVVQFVWLMTRVRAAGMALWPRRPVWNADIRLLVRRIVPGAIGAGIYQVNLVVDTVIASLLPGGSIAFLFYADRVTQLPLGVVGVAVGTALLPLLSRQLKSAPAEVALHTQNRALEVSLLLTVPAAAALMVIAHPVISVLFERGAFDATAARATAEALEIYALGLPAYVLVKALTPGFFAREDTATPVKVAGACMVVNLVLNLILMGPFLHVGIAMATVASAWTNAIMLAVLLRRRGYLAWDRRLASRLPRIVLASAGMAAVLWYGNGVLAPWLDGVAHLRIAALAVLVAGGMAVFALLAVVLGAARPADLKTLRRPQAP